jgi:hypothetical protein
MSSPSAFANTCRDLLERMINTVPKDVVLSDVVQFIPVKVASVQLSVTDNALNLKAMLRVSTVFSFKVPCLFYTDHTFNIV